MSDKILLDIKDLYKEYFGVPALKGVSFNIKEGEVHGLIGENGAGKSTLIKLIAGAISRTGGTLTFEGEDVEFQDPKSAIDKGVGVVYQEFNLFLNLSVYENIFYGMEISNKFGVLDRAKMIEESQKIIKRLGFDFDVRTPVSKLTTAYQQIVEIAKCIKRDVKLLIMDEPSAALTDNEVSKMFDVVRELNKDGVAIIYISHKLNEILDLSDRITVLRDGEFIATMDNQDVSEDDLIKYMVGRALEDIYPPKIYSYEPVKIECSNLSGGIVKDVSFSIRRGEVLGFGGLVGAGRTELMRLLYGADPKTSGVIKVDGEVVDIKSPKDSIEQHIALVPEDRKHHGLILNKNILFNASLPSLKSFKRKGHINYDVLEKEVSKSTNTLQLKANNLEQLVIHLSGGNQQKVVLSKWLIKNSEVLILDEPTRGIDIGAKQEVYLVIRDLAAQGRSVIVVSSEMPELIGLSHRVLVMKDGRISGEVEGEDMTQENIMRLAS